MTSKESLPIGSGFKDQIKTNLQRIYNGKKNDVDQR